jgi:hypothetical protein
MKAVSISRNEFRFDFSRSPKVRWGRSSGEGREDSVSQSMEYYVNDAKIAERFGCVLDSQLADWIDIALACYLADRLALRLTGRSAESGKQWARVFNLVVPVRKRARWSNVEVKERLEQLLHFFADDIWHFEFVERVGPLRPAESQGFLFGFDSKVPVRVALYSGGLDSFAGAARTVAEFSDSGFVFVSGVTNGRQRSAQRKQLGVLRKWSSRDIWHVGVPFGLLWSASGISHKEESSQRSRGFLFLTLGAVSAIAAGSRTLFLFENGIGAINLPYDGTQVGAYNSRATHPIALLRMQDFIERLTDNSFSIENPFAFSTKAEMCRHGAVQELRDHLDLTFSCDSFPIRARDKSQCGVCTSCLLRRLSIESAGLSAFDTKGYVNDLTSTGFSRSEKQLHSLRAMDWQVQRIKAALDQANPWQALVHEFVELRKLESELCRSGRTERHTLQGKLIRLYSQYAAEWESFSARRHCDRVRRIA